MKRTLLASTALVAFAGAASAEVTFSGSATLGYNDTRHGVASGIVATTAGGTTSADWGNGGDYTGAPTATSDNNYGFYWDADLMVTFSQELDNGVTAAANFKIDVASEGSNGVALSSADYVLSLTSDMASLYFGDTQFAAEKHWKSAGDMETDGFSNQDGETTIRGDVTYSGVNASVSYIVVTPQFGDANRWDLLDISAPIPQGTDNLIQLSIGADATFGNFTVAVAYQEAIDAAYQGIGIDYNGVDTFTACYSDNGDMNCDELFGLSVSTSFSGADVTVAYSKDNTTGADSTGIKVAYPVGPVTLTAYYVAESAAAGDNWGINAKYASGPFAVTVDYQDDQGTAKTAVDGSYDVGNGVMVYAGYYMQDNWDDSYYVAATYDLGGGASVLASYADGGSDDDAYGPNDYQQGTTVEVTFEF